MAQITEVDMQDHSTNIQNLQADIVEPPKSNTLALDASRNNLEKYYDVQIRVGQIDYPGNEVVSPFTRDPTQVKGIVNNIEKKVSLRINDINLGMADVSGTIGEQVPEKSYNVQDQRTYHVKNTDDIPNVPLTFPFIFTNASTWCGFNYLPPAGCKVLVGFGKHKAPYILGYLAENVKIMSPVLSPGEIMIKGLGNNYIHWGKDGVLTLYAGAIEGELDKNDYSKQLTNKETASCSIVLNANQGEIIFSTNNSQMRLNSQGISMSYTSGSNASMFNLNEGISSDTTGNISNSSASQTTNTPKNSDNTGAK